MFQSNSNKTHLECSLACSYTAICNGCDWLLRPTSEQIASKKSHILDVWRAAFEDGGAQLPENNFVSIADGGLRDRADLMLDRKTGTQRLGLFDRFQTGVVDLQGCPQMSDELERWLADFRRIQFPIERGSVRLRVSPSGQRGAWLDLANTDVKKLLDERTTLDQLRSMAIVEIGQKRKRLIEREGVLKLADPILEPWFETYAVDRSGREHTVPLFCAIGSFTQPGFKANRALVFETMRMISETDAKVAVEFGSGIGNFTFPLASVCEEVRAYEIDRLALDGLERSLTEIRAQGAFAIAEKIKIHSGNFQVERKDPVDFSGADLIFVDPPRSGLMKFLEPLEKIALSQRPKHFIYISCFAESFAADSVRLSELGYKIQSLSIVDQFPSSRHYEMAARFELQID